MKQEEKELLLKDLCARLPYNIRCKIIDTETDDVIESGYLMESDICHFRVSHTIEIYPYLRPMSSMTKEEYYEFRLLPLLNYESYDWLNSHYFDWRGLIGKGLAIEAPEDMYKFE